MDPGFSKLLNDDEVEKLQSKGQKRSYAAMSPFSPTGFMFHQDDNAPPAADVDAFAAVLKGDLGGVAQAAAAAAHGAARTANGSAQPVSQPPAAPVTTGHNAVKPVPPAPASTPSGQQPLWSQLTSEQQQAYIQRLPHHQQQQFYRQQAIQQQRLRQQQLHQQPHQQGQQPQRAEPASGAPGPRKGQIREGVLFTVLMPLLQPHLPAEQGQQLSVLYQKFKRNEISRQDFIRGVRVIAGDHVLVHTIREMHGKQAQQLELQQRELQQQKLREQQQQPQQQQQRQPQSSEPQATNPQLILPNVSASVASQQQQSKEQANVRQQNLQPQAAQSPSQTQELTVANAAQQKPPLGHSQAHPFLQTQVPSNADPKTVPGSQTQSNLSSSLPQPQPKSSLVKDQGQAPPPNNKTVGPMVLQQVKHEVDLSLAKQQAPSPMMPSIQPRPSPILQAAVVTGAGQPPEPYTQMGLPQPSHQSQTPGHIQLHQPQPLPQAPIPVTLQPQPTQAPSPAPAPQAQPQPGKGLTKYAKQKLRKEQKKRDEEERARKQEEERLKKVMEEENLKKLHSAPSGTVMAAHQGLHPQLSTPVDLNKQAYGHHPGSLSHQAQMQAPLSQLDKQQSVPVVSGGLVATGQGLPLIPIKQEPSDSQPEQKRQCFQVPKTLDLLPWQAGQKPVGQAQLSEAFALPTSQMQGANAGEVPGSMLLPSPSTATSLAKQADLASSMPATSLVSIPPLAGAPGLQSTVSMKQVSRNELWQCICQGHAR